MLSKVVSREFVRTDKSERDKKTKRWPSYSSVALESLSVPFRGSFY